MTSTVTKVDPPQNAGDLLKEYALAEAKLHQAKEEIKPLRKALLAMFPADVVGDFQMEAGGWVAEVQFPDKQTWDSDELAAYFGADLPVYVKRTFSITASDFARLPSEVRAALNGARIQGVGSPKISVEVRK